MVNDADYSRVGGGGGGGGAWLVADMSVYVSVPAARDHVALSLYDVDVERSVPPTPAVGRRGTFLRRAVAERREMPRCAPDETQLKPDLRVFFLSFDYFLHSFPTELESILEEFFFNSFLRRRCGRAFGRRWSRGRRSK